MAVECNTRLVSNFIKPISLLLLISCRLDWISSRSEFCTSLDQKWLHIFKESNFNLIMVPNEPSQINHLLNLKPNGIILSGGGDISCVDINMNIRDQCEALLIQYSESNNIPLIGICRGMQHLAIHHGAELEKIEGHTNCDHNIATDIGIIEVNSFHNYGFKSLPKHLIPTAVDPRDQSIEAFKHADLPHLGIMWHPERLQLDQAKSLSQFRNFFSHGQFFT